MESTLIVIGGRTAQSNRVAMFEAGVNAYLAKPIPVLELRARARATLRRFLMQNAHLRRLHLAGRPIDLEARRITNGGKDTHLTPTECSILQHLYAHLNHTVPTAELVKSLWGDDPHKGAHSLRLFIRKLRRKLEPDPAHPRYIITEPAIGYRLQSTNESM
jgi:two-component system KDP operon response regulator KdpE